MRKPFFIKARKLWYYKTESGKFVRLGPDKDDAFQLWKEMTDKTKSAQIRSKATSIIEIFETYLSEEELELTKEGFRKMKEAAIQFCLSFGENSHWSIVTKATVAKWLTEEKKGQKRKDGTCSTRYWGTARRRDMGGRIKRVFKWAHDNGLIDKNPLASMKLPTPKPRTQLVSREDHRKLVQACLASEEHRSFGIYLIASRCGARPQQIREVTSEHVSKISGSLVWVFSEHKTAESSQKKLTVFLPGCLQTLTRILMHVRPTGNLFLNGYGQPWKKDTVSQRMRRLRGELKLPDGIIAYAYRHTFATDALLAGVDIATVAALLGHKDSSMVARVYGHLDQHKSHMIEAVNKVFGVQVADKLSG